MSHKVHLNNVVCIFAGVCLYTMKDDVTWNTFGALTKDARADERVAEKIPALISGPKADTKLITYSKQHSVTETFIK